MTNSDRDVLRDYYAEIDFVLSAEGILKFLAILGCAAAGALFLGAGGAACAGDGGLVASGAAVALVAAAVAALLCAGVLCAVPLVAPLGWFYTELVASTVLGLLLLLTAILSLTLCQHSTVVDYFHGPLAMVNSFLMMGSAVVTYVAVTRRWDKARGPAREPPRAAPAELEV